MEEDIIDEKLPRDLAQIYIKRTYKNASHHGNARSSSQGSSMQGRRSALFDYQNATYDVISADEAMARVRANKADADKIRALYGDDYLEVELRNNGKIYPLHSPDYIGGYDSDKIRHMTQSMTGLNTLLQAADKIY